MPSSAMRQPADPAPAASSPTPRRRAPRRPLLLTLLATAAAIVAILALIHQATVGAARRAYERHIEELRALGEPTSVVEIAPTLPPDEENGAPLYQLAFLAAVATTGTQDAETTALHMIAHGEDGAEQWATREAAIAGSTAYVEANTRSLDLAARAADRPRTVFPHDWERGWQMDLPELLPIRTLGGVLGVRADLALVEGRPDDALADAHLGLRTARALDEEPVLISRLVQIVCGDMALDGLERALALGARPTADRSARVEADLLALADPARLLATLRTERAWGFTLFAEVEREGTNVLTQGTGVAPDPAERLAVTFLFQNDRLAYARALQAAIEAAETAPERALPATLDAAVAEALGDPQSLSRPLTGTLMPALSKIAFKDLAFRDRTRLARVALAALRHHAEHDAWPADADALVAGGALAAPVLGAIDGDPVRVQPLGDGELRIWTCGDDGVDDGGDPELDRVLFLPAPR